MRIFTNAFSRFLAPKRIYLDYAAATPVREEVRRAMSLCDREVFANASAIHREGQKAKEALETARQSLHTELRDALLARLETERPAGFVLYDDAVTFSFNSLPAVAYGDNLATIKEQGVLRVPLFKENDLAKFLAEKSVPGYEGLPVRLSDYKALTFAYTSPTTTISDISAQSELSFSLTGNAEIVWQFNENELKADLLGVEKTAISQILGKYPAIESAEAVVRPFWKTTFPREMREITVTEKIE